MGSLRFDPPQLDFQDVTKRREILKDLEGCVWTQHGDTENAIRNAMQA